MSALAPQPGPPAPAGGEAPGEAILVQMIQLAQHFIQTADDPQDKEGMAHVAAALVALAQAERAEPAPGAGAMAPQGLGGPFQGALASRGIGGQ